MYPRPRPGLFLALPLSSVAFFPCNLLGEETRSSIPEPPTDQGWTCLSTPCSLGSENLEVRLECGQGRSAPQLLAGAVSPPGSKWELLTFQVLLLSRLTCHLGGVAGGNSQERELASRVLGFLKQSWDRRGRVAGPLPCGQVSENLVGSANKRPVLLLCKSLRAGRCICRLGAPPVTAS